MTKRAVVTTIWKQRDVMSEVREAATPGVRENVFPGKRVKAFIAQAHAQLDGAPARRRSPRDLLAVGRRSTGVGPLDPGSAEAAICAAGAGVVSRSCRCRRTRRAADGL